MIRAARNEDEAAIVVERELAEIIELTVDAGERGELYRRMARQVRAATSRARPVTLVPSDFKGALASFWLVFVGSIPAALPFLMIDDAWIALRVSNAILLGQPPREIGRSARIAGTALPRACAAHGAIRRGPRREVRAPCVTRWVPGAINYRYRQSRCNSSTQ